LLGEEVWGWVMTMSHVPFFMLAEYTVFIAFVFHGLNGLRLIAIELGFVIGQPEQPVYPYHGSITRQRPLTIVMMVLAGVLILAAGFELLGFPGPGGD
jgi:succinate dehydrogenase/fumarate reductase cytochrome b subunit